jgi:2'-5' RNA ligase
MRLFTAILLPAEVREHLRGACEELNQFAVEHGVKWTKVELLHVTLKFFGEVPESRVAELLRSLGDVVVEPATVSADRLLLLPPRGPVRIVAASIAGEVAKLVELNDAIEASASAAGFPREARPYLPHVTLGRNRPGRYQTVAGWFRTHSDAPQCWPGPSFRAEGFALMQSVLDQRRPQYLAVAHFPAAGQTP